MLNETEIPQEVEPLTQVDEVDMINECLSYTKSADDQVLSHQDHHLVDCDGKEIVHDFTLQYTNNYYCDQLTTVGGMTESPEKPEGCNNNTDMFSECMIATAASTRNRSFSQMTEQLTSVAGDGHRDHMKHRRKQSLIFNDENEVNDDIEQIERRSVGNRSHQPEIEDHNQIQIPIENFDELERADLQTQVDMDEIRDNDNDLPVPNDEIEPPPDERKVEVFDDYIQETPGEVVGQSTGSCTRRRHPIFAAGDSQETQSNNSLEKVERGSCSL